MNKIFFLILSLLGLFSVFSILGLNSVNAADDDTTTYKFGDSSYAKGVGVSGASTDPSATDDSLIEVIKKFVNRILGILSLISLIILLRGGFQMVTAAGDDGKFKKGFTILKQAGIGLAFIAVSWLIIGLIFWLLTEVGAGA